MDKIVFTILYLQKNLSSADIAFLVDRSEEYIDKMMRSFKYDHGNVDGDRHGWFLTKRGIMLASQTLAEFNNLIKILYP